MDLLLTNALPTTILMRQQYGENVGRLLTPRHYSKAVETAELGIPMAADNDCFQGLDEAAFNAMLETLAPVADKLLWVTAPDVVGDAEATLERFEYWGAEIRSRGFKVALVLQDGMTYESVPWGSFDAVFIGGSTEWKLGEDAAEIAARARIIGLPVHMGRVNSQKRVRIAAAAGCTTVDGSGWCKFKREMMPRWAVVDAEINGQQVAEAA